MTGKVDRTGKRKALSFQEPWATLIATGQKNIEFRSRKINTPVKDLVVCASKTASQYEPIPGLVYGKAVGLVDIVSCKPYAGGGNAWRLKNPRLIKPFDVHATASFFYIDDVPEVVETTIEAYRRYVLPLAFAQDDEAVDDVIDAMFGNRRLLRGMFGIDNPNK